MSRASSPRTWPSTSNTGAVAAKSGSIITALGLHAELDLLPLLDRLVQAILLLPALVVAGLALRIRLDVHFADGSSDVGGHGVVPPQLHGPRHPQRLAGRRLTRLPLDAGL